MFCLFILKHSAAEGGASIFSESSEAVSVSQTAFGFRECDDNWQINSSDLNSESTRPDDPRPLDIIRQHYLMPASAEPYAFAVMSVPSVGQTTIVDNFFKQKTHGVFVECGAIDGQFLSNTLFLERFRSWTGLLIEPEPRNFKALKKRHRKALIANSCLSSKPHPSEFVLRQAWALSEILDFNNISYDHETIGNGDVSYKIVQCFPFYFFLLAANITAIDYFSLDIEGQELNVLKTIPWHRVDIKMISVEHKHVKEGKAAVNAHMAAAGYVAYEEMTDGAGTPGDVIFVRRDLVE
ncbi:protein Star-like [Hyalella azteca]|uniref:Protein Star-like n=1 Tax=Hyalella azteca TaxID=294128 RepID=A0A8B7ND11_HYAAZ|nr:protein Star-like [Hyalella azteca]